MKKITSLHLVIEDVIIVYILNVKINEENFGEIYYAIATLMRDLLED